MEKVYHIGIDLHKKFSVIVFVDAAGKVIDRKRVINDKGFIAESLSGVSRDSCITYEATYNWYWLYDFLIELGFKVKMAHPKKVRIIAESTIKTDNIDAEVLAQLERTNFLPESYVPPKEIREVKELLRYRLSLVNHRRELKNRIHAVLGKCGIISELTDLFGKSGREFLDRITLAQIFRTEIDGYLSIIDSINERIAESEKRIKKMATENKEAQILMTAPGISYFSSMLLLSEIGTIDRFPAAKKLFAYAGVVSSTKESADKVRHGHIIRDSNKYIRWILIEAIDWAIKKDERLAKFYRKISVKRGKQIARIATARKLLESIYYMLKNKQEYIYKSSSKLCIDKY